MTCKGRTLWTELCENEVEKSQVIKTSQADKSQGWCNNIIHTHMSRGTGFMGFRLCRSSEQDAMGWT